jgi:predicted SAM-dependent methyltransferase
MKLHLGSGPHVKEGWLNYDIDAHPGVIRCDLSMMVPQPNGVADYIFTEHFIEHLDREQGQRFLNECFRVLKQDSVLRISTPDLNTVMKDYLNKKIDRHKGGWEPKSACRMVNEGLRLWGHQFVYDFEELSHALYDAGFTDVYEEQWHDSSFVDLQNLEIRPYRDDLILEAVKL